MPCGHCGAVVSLRSVRPDSLWGQQLWFCCLVRSHKIRKKQQWVLLQGIINVCNLCWCFSHQYLLIKVTSHGNVFHITVFSGFVREIHRRPMDSAHKGLWCRAFMIALMVGYRNKLLSKQSSCQWFWILWRWCDVFVMGHKICCLLQSERQEAFVP